MNQVASRFTVLSSALLLVSLQSCVEDRFDSVAVRTWDIEASSTGFPPELADEELAVPWLKDRASFGVAFSGGGTRSATASLGELRALTDLGWLRQARHISSNSGSSWAVVPYIYLPKNIEEKNFLGDYVRPEELDDQQLSPATGNPFAMGTAIHNASTIDEILALGRGDEAYSDIVGSIFLDPFGLHDNEKFFTFHQGALEEIIAGNPTLGRDDFYTVEREDRPYLIVTGTMLAEQLSEDPQDYFPIEMTPLYSGIRGRFLFEKDGETVLVGGGYVESFGYDSYEPQGERVNGRWHVRLSGLLGRGDKPVGDRYKFTLSDVIGTSSAAPLVTLSRHSVPNIAFPEFRHWPVDQESITRSDERVRRKADEFQHGDGGDLDNLALMPLLVRKTENILAFINTAQAFIPPPTGCNDISEEYISDDIVSLFRQTGRLVHNKVFKNGEAELQNLCEEFVTRRRLGQSLVHCQPYDIVENPRYRIEAYRTTICWMYLDRVSKWVTKIDRNAGDLTRQLHDGTGTFDTFPHYSTFVEQGISLIDLDPERVNALSNLTAWMVYDSADYIAKNLESALLTTQEKESNTEISPRDSLQQ